MMYNNLSMRNFLLTFAHKMKFTELEQMRLTQGAILTACFRKAK